MQMSDWIIALVKYFVLMRHFMLGEIMRKKRWCINYARFIVTALRILYNNKTSRKQWSSQRKLLQEDQHSIYSVCNLDNCDCVCRRELSCILHLTLLHLLANYSRGINAARHKHFLKAQWVCVCRCYKLKWYKLALPLGAACRSSSS